MAGLGEFDRGFLAACSQMKDWISAGHQRVSDKEGHQVLDWIWDEIKKVESEKLGRAPFDEPTQS